jgi:DDE superfamily endonuclease/Helix-turn-helix of DDE superfamily endonuclease
MYHTTGLTYAQIIDICVRVENLPLSAHGNTWPPILGLFDSIVVTLTYLRRNRVQAELAETYAVSQSTISRAITAITPRLEAVTREFVPTAENLDSEKTYIVDGSLLPCWSWRSCPDLYSGKHKTTGKNIQVMCDLDGGLAWISDPVDGRRHDSYCLDESGILDLLDPKKTMGDKGYVGKSMITPIKKLRYRELLEWEKEFNTQVNKIRYMIERTIANFKTWRIMHTDFRRPLDKFEETISATVGLHFYRMA